MKVLLASCGTRGDVQPALALGLALMEAGHEILLSAPPEHGDWIAGYDCPYQPLGGNWQEIVTRYPDGLGLGAMVGLARFLRREARSQFEELPAIMEGFDLVVGFSLVVALHSVAQHLDLPSYWVATTPQLLPSAAHPPVMSKKQDLPGWVNRLAWGQSRLVTDLVLKGLINERRKTLGLAPIDNIVDYNCGEKVLVASDPELGEVPDDVAINNVQLGHFLLKQKGDLDPEIEDFIESGPPPIYVGFGSMAARAEKMTWIVVEAVRGAGQRLILASGWANLGGIEPADDLLVIGSVPHDRLFPRMKAVIHHGGAGTTATAARAGIPQIIVPHLLDQFYWAHQILKKRLGPKGIAQSKLSSKSLQKAIEITLANSEFAENAVRLAGRLENMDGTRQAIAFLNKAGRRAT